MPVWLVIYHLIVSIGTRRVLANEVYQQYIRDKNHYHMNATRVSGGVREGGCGKVTDRGVA